MKVTDFIIVCAFVLTTVFSITLLVNIGRYRQTTNTLTAQMAQFEANYLKQSQANPQVVTDSPIVFGTTQPFAGQTYNIAGSGTSPSATSIVLTSLTIKQTGQPILTADLVGSGGGTYYVTLEPGSNTKQEIVGCTGVTQGATTATLTGCSRGLAPISPYTASTTLQFTHSGGSAVIFSDPPQLFNQYAALGNSQTITGQWTFSNTPTITNGAVNPTDAVNYATLLATAISGAGTSTFSTMGIVRLATSLQIASGTASSSPGVQGGSPLVLASKFSTTSPGVLCNTGIWNCIPVANTNGFLSQLWLDLSAAFTWTGTQIFNGAFTANSTASFTATTTITGVSPQSKPGQNYTSASTTTNWPMPFVIATSTGLAFPAISNLASTTINFVGFTQTNATLGQPLFVQTSGVVSGFSGLTIGADYYLQDGTGATIGTTPGTLDGFVGIAVSATQLLLKPASGMQYLGTASGGTATAIPVPTFTRMAVCSDVVTVGGTNNFLTTDLTVNRIGKTTATESAVFTNGGGAAVRSVTSTITWTGSSITTTAAETTNSTATSAAVTCYFYR